MLIINIILYKKLIKLNLKKNIYLYIIMDYKKLYLEYKQKYLMSQKYLMEGGAQTQDGINRGTKYLAEESTYLEQLLLELNNTPYTIYNSDDDMANINGKSMGQKPKNLLRQTIESSPPLDEFHNKTLQLKYLFINETTLEDLGNCDEFFKGLIAEDPQVYEKKFLTISYNP